MLYDYDLKYETTIKVTFDACDVSFNDMLETLNIPRITKTGEMTIDHKVSVTDSPVLPQQSFIEATKENILNCMKDAFKKENQSMKVAVLKTDFIGIVNLIEKE